MAKTARAFTYQKRTVDDVKARANQSTGDFDRWIKPEYKRYKMKDGKNLVRILPPTWAKPNHYGYEIYVNFAIGPDNQSYLSLSKMKQEQDPLAEARTVANREGDEELAKQLEARKRVLMWVIDREDEDEGPQLFDAPVTLDKAIANLSMDEDTKEVIFIDDPDEGCDLRFYREGKGMLTKYDASKMRLMKPTPLCDDADKAADWLDYVTQNPVPECLQYYSYEHIAAVFDGKAAKPKAKDEDAEEATPKRTGRRETEAVEEKAARPRLRAVAKEPEPADEEDDPPFDTDEEEKPAKAMSISERLKQRRQAIHASTEDED